MIGEPFTTGSAKFGGESRITSSVDRQFGSLDVGQNAVINPDGRVAMRSGYAAQFSTRDNWFEFTTLHANRLIENNIISGDVLAYNSPRRKCLLEGVSGGVRYLFTGYVLQTSGTLDVIVHRGTIAANGAVTWSAGVVVASSAIGTNPFKYLGDDSLAAAGASDLQRWMEFSMVMTPDRSRLFIAVVDRNDSLSGGGSPDNYGTLRVYEKNTPYQAVWSAGVTALALETGGSTTITVNGNDAITHDVDIAVDSANGITVCYGYWDNANTRYAIHIRRVEASYYDTQPFILTAAGFNLYGCALVYNTAKSRMMLFYVRDGAADTINFVEWTNSAIDPSSDATRTQLVTAFAIFATTGGLFANIPAVCIDSDGDVHLLYRADAVGNLIYTFYDYDAGTVAHTNLAGFFDTEINDSSAQTSGLISYLHNWDMIVRGSGATLSVHIYYVEEHATTGRTIRLCERFAPGAFAVKAGKIHLSQNDPPMVMFLMADRTTQTRASRQLVFLDLDTTGTDEVDFMHLTEMLDAAQSDISIEAMHEMGLPQTDDTVVQTLFVQCDDSRFYKRASTSNYWEVLENSMDTDNAADGWWTRLDKTLANGGYGTELTRPDPTPHARFDDDKGVLRAGIGLGTRLLPIRYSMINRYIGDNTNNRYQDHYLDVDSALTPPDINNIATEPTTGTAQVFSIGSVNNPVSGNLFAIGRNPSKYDYINYRPFLKFNELANPIDNTLIDEDWKPSYSIDAADYARLSAFYIALSYQYDNGQESQLFHLPSSAYRYDIPDNVYQRLSDSYFAGQFIKSSGCVLIGIWWNQAADAGEVYSYIGVPLAFKSWNTATTPGNPRVTAIRIWMSEVLTPTQDPLHSDFKMVKSVLVGKREAFDTTSNATNITLRNWPNDYNLGGVANGQPAGKPWDGDSVWDYDGTDTYSLTDEKVVVIDIEDWVAAQSAGSYDEINGHTDIDFDTVLGLHRSPFVESYKQGITMNGKRLVGGITKDGVNRPGRISACAIRSEESSASYMQEVFPDDNDIDLPFTFQSWGKLDDDTAVAVGDSGIAVIDTRDMTIREIDRSLGSGAPDSVVTTKSGVYFGSDDRIRLYDGFRKPKSIAEEIVNNADIGSYPGISGITAAGKADCWAFQLPRSEQALWFYRQSPTSVVCFRYDYIKKAWSRFALADNFKCGCVGLDGELFWTSNYEVFNYPSGTNDAGTGISPLIILSGQRIGDHNWLDMGRLFLTYRSDAAVSVAIIRDKAAIANITHSFAASTSFTNIMRQLSLDSGRSADREITLQISSTTPTYWEIEDVNLTGMLLRRVA